MTTCKHCGTEYDANLGDEHTAKHCLAVQLSAANARVKELKEENDEYARTYGQWESKKVAAAKAQLAVLVDARAVVTQRIANLEAQLANAKREADVQDVTVCELMGQRDALRLRVAELREALIAADEALAGGADGRTYPMSDVCQRITEALAAPQAPRKEG